MGVEMTGFAKLRSELQAMAGEISDTFDSTALDGVLEAGANIILEQVRINAASAFKDKTGKLRASLKSRKANKNGVKKIKVGSIGAPHAHLVEFGHGGPHPAGPHPFIMPAYDQKKEEAYTAIRDGVAARLKELTR